MTLCEPITRDLVQRFEAASRELPPSLHVDPKGLTLRHHFAPGLYLREVHVPAGLVTVGKIHKFPCINILAKGDRSTLIDGRIERIQAPHVSTSPAGMKRVSYTHADSVWMTVHATSLTDIDEIERELVCDSEEEYRAFLMRAESQPCLS